MHSVNLSQWTECRIGVLWHALGAASSEFAGDGLVETSGAYTKENYSNQVWSEQVQ